MAYAAVISLKYSIQRLINLTNTNIPNIKSADEELQSVGLTLKRLDDNTNISVNRSVIDSLDAKIREAACELEDVVESYMLYHYFPPSHSHGDEDCPQIPRIDVKGVEQEIDLFLEKVKKLREEYNTELNRLPKDDAVSPIDEKGVKQKIDLISKTVNKLGEELDKALPRDEIAGKKSTTTTVGLSDELEEIINELVDFQSRLKIVSIFGMAGIGKTHLARNVYEHQSITQEFDVRVWASIGPKFEIKKVLADIAAQIIGNKRRNAYMEDAKNTLADRVYRSFSGQRYFIVLDDIWSTEAWDHLKSLFPIEQNGSRLLLTTRREEAAKYPTKSDNVHQLRLLNNEESWNLLWQNVFDGGYFPRELEKAGRKIAEHCEGLPLLILAVARILRDVEQKDARILREVEHKEKREKFWKEVASKKHTTFQEAYDNISKQLLLSYEYLPQYLKACVLYMGVFPQNSKVHVAKLIHLWTLEDFVEQNGSQTFEYFAMDCLQKLVSQSLVIICSKSISYGIKSCKLHSAYWHVFVKEAKKNKFFHVLNNRSDGDSIENSSRLCVQNNILFAIEEVCGAMADTLRARSLLCTGEDHQYPVPICLNLMLLKVLDALAIRFYEFPNEVLELLQLRYLALTVNGGLPSLLSKLQNIQNLIVRRYHNVKVISNSTRLSKKTIQFLKDSTSLPKEIWDMQELRHLRIIGSNLPDPSNGALLQNLLTFHADAHSCSEDVFRGIPNLKKLGIKIELQPEAAETLGCFQHISILHDLESLKCFVANPRLGSQVELLKLPDRLKKLSLNGLGYSWDYMSVIGLLPNLQVLKVQCSAFQGPKWETKVEEFPRLEFLLLEDIDLVHWTTDDEEWLPSLRRLIIRNCYKLKKIPSQVGAIDVLETIEVVDCSSSVVASALQIKETEEEYGNFYLQVMISSSWKL